MKILHNRKTEKHNVGSFCEGAYRVKNFPETVSSEQIEELRPLAERCIELIHPQEYVQNIIKACEVGDILAEVTLSKDSFNAIIASVVMSVIAAQENAFAVTRPPGHHASNQRAEGFCLLNNIAIATAYLLEMNKKVLIIDFDGHHGNGTQSIFKSENRVMFCSIHQGGIYPYSGYANEIGIGPSYKQLINIPIRGGSGDDVFIKALEFIIDITAFFNPDHIAISAGFDGYKGDNLLNLRYSKKGYYEAGKLLSSLNKPVFAVLEGGYHNEIPDCVNALIAGILGRSFVTDENFENSSQICLQHIDEVLKMISDLFS